VKYKHSAPPLILAMAMNFSSGGQRSKVRSSVTHVSPYNTYFYHFMIVSFFSFLRGQTDTHRQTLLNTILASPATTREKLYSGVTGKTSGLRSNVQPNTYWVRVLRVPFKFKCSCITLKRKLCHCPRNISQFVWKTKRI